MVILNLRVFQTFYAAPVGTYFKHSANKFGFAHLFVSKTRANWVRRPRNGSEKAWHWDRIMWQQGGIKKKLKSNRKIRKAVWDIFKLMINIVTRFKVLRNNKYSSLSNPQPFTCHMVKETNSPSLVYFEHWLCSKNHARCFTYIISNPLNPQGFGDRKMRLPEFKPFP